MRSIGGCTKSGKKLENLKSSEGSPFMLVSGCCWKKRRYSQALYVPNSRNGREDQALSTKARGAATSRKTLGKNCRQSE